MMASDTKAQNTGGGTFTLGAWRTRDINTEDQDTGANMSISSNQITLDAGTYRTIISCPSFNVGINQTRLYNTTDAALELAGTCEYCDAATVSTSRSWIIGRFTIASQKTFEIQHYSTATKTDNGFGVANNLMSEIYTVAEFWKEA
jgi:hypothetical protein